MQAVRLSPTRCSISQPQGAFKRSRVSKIFARPKFSRFDRSFFNQLNFALEGSQCFVLRCVACALYRLLPDFHSRGKISFATFKFSGDRSLTPMNRREKPIAADCPRAQASISDYMLVFRSIRGLPTTAATPLLLTLLSACVHIQHLQTKIRNDSHLQVQPA